MGLLDDAIREHLDLKRRRGADPEEIERAEREALGPVRRNRDTAAADQLTADPVLEGAEDGPQVGSAYDEPDEAIAADLVESGPEYEPDPGDDADLVDDAHRTGELWRDASTEADDDPFTGEESSQDPPAHSGGEIPTPGDATAEFDVSAALAAEDATRVHPATADDDEDVLEETPEFLQDTPDHDRLWFEQRPPRDFDFDG